MVNMDIFIKDLHIKREGAMTGEGGGRGGGLTDVKYFFFINHHAYCGARGYSSRLCERNTC
jgi:hypothetical protein